MHEAHLPVIVVRFCVKSAAVSSFAVRPEYRTISTVIWYRIASNMMLDSTTIVRRNGRSQHAQYHTVSTVPYLPYLNTDTVIHRTRSGSTLGEVDGRELLGSQSVRRLRPIVGRHLARRATVRLQARF